MKRSLAHGAGYLVIDHRDSPGTPEVPGGTLLERDVMTCRHCERAVVLHPGRVRARAVCPKCHAYICDGCEAARVASGGACVPFRAALDRAAEIIVRYLGQPDHPEAALDLTTLSAPANPRIAVESSRILSPKE